MSTVTHEIERIARDLETANARFAQDFPGDPVQRQPVHTVYGGAQLYKATTTATIGRLALRALDEHAPEPQALADALQWDLDPAMTRTIYERVRGKLEREPVEDFRIDFEDGYGSRPDDEEDAEALRAAREVAAALRDDVLPPTIGIRIKPFSQELAARGMRTLELFAGTLLQESKGALPGNFVITLPKVQIAEQVTALVRLLEHIERRHDLDQGTLRFELMVETPQSLIAGDGSVNLPRLVDAGEGRVTAAHFGTYDYTALCNITAAHQHMTHDACDFARNMMQVSLAQRGVMMSDGATNIMPIGPHRAEAGGSLSEQQLAENRDVVHRAWRLSHQHIMHSLVNAFYQGWDLHPAQLPIRYASVYLFFLEGLESASARLRNFMQKAAQATLVGDVFDDAATGQGLLNYFLRALSCGAITEDEALQTGLTLDELRSRSFHAILAGRRSAG